MQLTLVSYYGEKPPSFVRLIGELQGMLVQLLGNGLCPYESPQVHATIAGLEGTRRGNSIRNDNFFQYRGEERFMDFAGLLNFLRHEFTGFEIQVGGFRSDHDYGFTSQGQSPFTRSFSLQNGIAVGMGWPMRADAISSALDEFRRCVQKFGVLHKWHRHADAVDNDFFFVLGRMSSTVPEPERIAAEEAVRYWLADREPILLPVNRDTLALVAYNDSQLPLASSQIFHVGARQVTPKVLAGVYGE